MKLISCYFPDDREPTIDVALARIAAAGNGNAVPTTATVNIEMENNDQEIP